MARPIKKRPQADKGDIGMKYIIRNCPAYNEKGCLYSAAIFPNESMQNRYITFAVPCKDCTDCILKQIVKITKNYTKGCGKHCDINRKENNCGKKCNAYKIRQILELLDIQEVE